MHLIQGREAPFLSPIIIIIALLIGRTLKVLYEGQWFCYDKGTPRDHRAQSHSSPGGGRAGCMVRSPRAPVAKVKMTVLSEGVVLLCFVSFMITW